MKVNKEDKERALETLRKYVKPGDTVYTVLRSVSRSGMSRHIDLYVYADGRHQWLSGWASDALGLRLAKNESGLVASGCGTDMGFHIVYNLAATLWPDGHGCTGENCRSNDHSNGDRDRTPHGNGMTPHLREVLIGADHWHRDGGYALRHEWI